MTDNQFSPNRDDQQASEDRYTREIGDRVRAMRARRGMARKQLSEQSDISERYLAQLETGKANISIVLLHRLARAMVVPLTDLLPDAGDATLPQKLLDLLHRLSSDQQDQAFQLLSSHFDSQRDRHAGVALIGLRGGGKTHLGQMLADELKIPFVRISEKVEEIGGMTMSEIMALGGQAAYRRLESEALDTVMDEHSFCVLEAGGSLVSEPETYQRLLSSYFTVWLKARPEDHMNRVIAQGDTRPMQGNRRAMDDLKKILLEREADYRQADYTINTSDRNIHDCFNELLRVVRPHFNKQMTQ
ncbi:helix-turn-helix transcriptional regulator [Saccharospirillum sp.]|uniref:helix-turn-helix transcriptional regulator n=1 Tax=Saccharospirillum sp. TaxID=2033801 RepID=UPI00349FE54E